MFGGSGWGWWMGFGWIFMVLVPVLIVIGVVAFIRGVETPWSERRAPKPRAPLEVLQDRYARGEIERKEYEQKRRDLQT